MKARRKAQARRPLFVGARRVVGWREWVGLPGLGIPSIKAKFDTGARSSALHAFFIEPFAEDGRKMLRFGIHPLQGRTDVARLCTAPALDRRWVTDSGGHRERRWVIEVLLGVGEEEWPIEMTLTGRGTMRFRLLIGRTAMRSRLVVDPKRSYLMGRLSRAAQRTLLERETAPSDREPTDP